MFVKCGTDLGSNANAFAFENVVFAFKCSVVSFAAFALAFESKHLHLHKINTFPFA